MIYTLLNIILECCGNIGGILNQSGVKGNTFIKIQEWKDFQGVGSTCKNLKVRNIPNRENLYFKIKHLEIDYYTL